MGVAPIDDSARPDMTLNDFGSEPDVVMACCGDGPTLETLDAVELLKQHAPQPGQISARKILGFPSPNQALSRRYADPHGLFFFCAPIPPQRRAQDSVGAARSPPSVVPFRLHFGSSGPLSK